MQKFMGSPLRLCAGGDGVAVPSSMLTHCRNGYLFLYAWDSGWFRLLALSLWSGVG